MTNVVEVIDASGRQRQLDVNFNGSCWQVVCWSARREVLADGIADHAAAVRKLTEIAQGLSRGKA